MLRSSEYFSTILCFLILILRSSSGKILISGTREWGTLCNLNTTEFQPGNIDHQNTLLSLFPRLRNLKTIATKPVHKPCCFPRTWEASFIVHTRRIGRAPKSNRCIYRILRNPSNFSDFQALIIIGQNVYSNSMCDDWKGPSIQTCPRDEKICLQVPFIGEPRCISAENGFNYVPMNENSQKEMWFTDSRIPSGGINRHIYIFSRKYEICKLEQYEVLTGQYVDSRTNCRMMFLMDEVFIPTPGSFNINFNYSITDGLFRC